MGTQIYEKPVTELLKDFVNTWSENNGIFSKKDILNWFNKKYPKILDTTITAHIILFSTNDKNRIHYSRHSNGKCDVLFKINEHTYRNYNEINDPAPIYKNAISEKKDDEPIDIDIKNDSNSSSTFAYEEDLKNYLAKNLDTIENGLTLYEEEGITGLEFNVGGRFIDILATDKNNDFVVIELKVSKSYDRVIGQLLRYKNWLQKKYSNENKKVRGIIIGKEITEDLVISCMGLPDIKLFEYELSFKLSEKEF